MQGSFVPSSADARLSKFPQDRRAAGWRVVFFRVGSSSSVVAAVEIKCAALLRKLSERLRFTGVQPFCIYIRAGSVSAACWVYIIRDVLVTRAVSHRNSGRLVLNNHGVLD